MLLAVPCMWVAAAGAQESSPGPERTSMDGVYQGAQADMGRQVFEGTCAYCHTVSQFRGSAFTSRWSGGTLNLLYDLIRTTMPIDSPGGLPPEEYAAVLAYFLRLNGFPPGPEPLGTDSQELRRIRIVTPPQTGNGSPGARR